MQNFPNNIVLTSLCYFKYYTMCRCLSMSVMPVKAARFVRGACSQFPLQVHHVHQLYPALVDGVVVVVGEKVFDQMVPVKAAGLIKGDGGGAVSGAHL